MTDDAWFSGAGLGLFVHWDHASQQGLEISWPLVGGITSVLPHCQSVTVEQYQSSAATFDPGEFDAAGLARLARQAGAAYAVLTAKHHAGYAMWPSKLTDFASSRDLVGEFVAAMRAEGVRPGLYYSLSDWHHPDYPAFTEEHKPYRFGASPPPPPPEVWERYWDFMAGQLHELLTGYGPIHVLWFDGGWERAAPMWRAERLGELIRSWQPDILINDRLPGAADFVTPEQFVPPTPPDGRWETCMTMNESWGYNPDDHDYKSGRDLVHTLCEVAGRGGNLLLNVSPTGTGSVPKEQAERLETIGAWMQRHASAVTGVTPGLEPWQWYGPSTRAGNRIFVHLLMRPYEAVTVRGLPIRRVKAVTELASGTELAFSTRCSVLDSFTTDPTGEVRITVPPELVDDLATVLAIEVADVT